MRTAALELDPHVLNTRSHGQWITAYLTPGDFAPADIDLGSLRLAGSLAPEPKTPRVGDHDADGVQELALKFSRSGLAAILPDGLNTVELTGSLTTGDSFSGSAEIRVISPGKGSAPSVAPNPLNPSGVLTFQTSLPGPVSVRMFDLHGRLVRDMVEWPLVAPGVHEVKIDGKDSRGKGLASGVYFYRLHTADGTTTGRIAVLK